MDFIPVNEPLLDGNEKKYLSECIDTGWISSEGPFVKKLEENFSGITGRKYGVAVCNGTSALEAAVIASGISEGDEVILPSFTIISCASSIVRAGARPVLVDSDPDTFNMDVTQIEKKITEKTKAIMAVHIYGLPVDMNPLIGLAKKYDLKIIEDSSEAIGQTYYEKHCGSFGDVSTFSFYPNKHITTGEGGMIVTDNEEIAERCRSLRNLCFIPGKRFVHNELGFNFRMTNMQAALGVAQLERLSEFIKKKRWIGKMYHEGLKDIPYLKLPLRETGFSKNIYWVYGIVLKEEACFNAETAMKKLADKKIETRPFFYPMHLQPVFKKKGLFKNELYPVSEKLAEMGFYLPSGLALNELQISRSIEAIRSLF